MSIKGWLACKTLHLHLCRVVDGAISNGRGSFSSVKGEEPRLGLRDSFDTKSRKVHANEHGSITVICIMSR